jgi:hypothetical protein
MGSSPHPHQDTTENIQEMDPVIQTDNIKEVFNRKNIAKHNVYVINLAPFSFVSQGQIVYITFMF